MAVKMIFNSKKGSAASEMWAPDTIVFWILYGLGLAFAAVYFVLILSKLGSEQTVIHENIDNLIFEQRFLKSQDCFLLNDDGVVRMGIVDSDKFNEQKLNSCYGQIMKAFPDFRLTLNSDFIKLTKTIKTTNWDDNKEFDERKAPIDVLTYYNNKLYNGELTIELQNHK